MKAIWPAFLGVMFFLNGCCHRGPEPADARAAAADLCRKTLAGGEPAEGGAASSAQATIEEKMLQEMVRYGDDHTRKTISNFTGQDVSVEILARVESQAERLFFVWLEDGWHLVRGGMLDSPPRTPGQAVARLAQALESGDCEGLIGLAPPEVVFRLGRDKLLQGCRGAGEELARRAGLVRQADPAKLRREGDRALLELEDKSTLRLVKAGGGWFVDDL